MNRSLHSRSEAPIDQTSKLITNQIPTLCNLSNLIFLLLFLWSTRSYMIVWPPVWCYSILWPAGLSRFSPWKSINITLHASIWSMIRYKTQRYHSKLFFSFILRLVLLTSGNLVFVDKQFFYLHSLSRLYIAMYWSATLLLRKVIPSSGLCWEVDL